MRIRRAVTAAGIAVAPFGLLVAPFGLLVATAGTAAAQTPTLPAVTGVITGLHTFTLKTGDTVVLGELLRPETPFYEGDVPVTGISTVRGVTTVTTGSTFLPLNRANEVTTFKVILPPR